MTSNETFIHIDIDTYHHIHNRHYAKATHFKHHNILYELDDVTVTYLADGIEDTRRYYTVHGAESTGRLITIRLQPHEKIEIKIVDQFDKLRNLRDEHDKRQQELRELEENRDMIRLLQSLIDEQNAQENLRRAVQGIQDETGI